MKRHSTIALGFIALILIGAFVLSLPQVRADGQWGSCLDSLFTACSAVCVTGLTVVNVGAVYNRTGWIVLLILVEIGCVGLMTCGTFLMIAIGRRLSLHSEFSLMNAYGVPVVRGLRGLICWVVGSMITFQIIGAVALHICERDWFMAIFYSIMNFCNAGFSIFDGSIVRWADRPYPLMIMGMLTIIGGIGFLVLYNLFTFRFISFTAANRGRLSLHTKTVLRVSLILLLITFAAFLVIEWGHSLAGMSVDKKLWVGVYQAITPRTCGFCVIPTEDLQPITRLIYEILMFFGGAPGSAAGGIKVTTLAVLVYTLRAMCRGESETTISQRMVPYDIVRESIVIAIVLASLIGVVFGALLMTESGGCISYEALLFESVSAVTTTGLSVGDTTSSLSTAGRIVIMSAMFAGRLGALTVVMMIGDRESKRHIRYPSEELVVG